MTVQAQTYPESPELHFHSLVLVWSDPKLLSKRSRSNPIALFWTGRNFTKFNFTKFLKHGLKARRKASPQPSGLWVDQPVFVLAALFCRLSAPNFCGSGQGVPSGLEENSPHRVVWLLGEAILQNCVSAWRECISRRESNFLHGQIVVGGRGMALN